MLNEIICIVGLIVLILVYCSILDEAIDSDDKRLIYLNIITILFFIAILIYFITLLF